VLPLASEAIRFDLLGRRYDDDRAGDALVIRMTLPNRRLTILPGVTS